MRYATARAEATVRASRSDTSFALRLQEDLLWDVYEKFEGFDPGANEVCRCEWSIRRKRLSL